MALYVCFHCRTEIDIKDANANIVCPKCSGRIFFKQPPEIRRRIDAV